MKKRTRTKALWIVAVIFLVVTLFYSEAFAWGGNFHRGNRRDWEWSRLCRYDYDRSCDSDFFGFKIVLMPKASNIVVKVPAEHKTITVNDDTVTIYVSNSNGSYMPVTLVRHGNGYIGPQGEYYAGNPTVAQLKVLYGR